MKALPLLTLLALSSSLSAAALAEPLGTHQPRIEGSVGIRASKVSNDGFDPFADSDDLLQVSLGLGGTVLKLDKLSLAAVGYWDYGSRSSYARGASTSLEMHRLSAGPELRYHLHRQLYVFAHVLPGAGYSVASLRDEAAQADRYARHWSFALDGGAGAALEVYGARGGETNRPRLWVTAEGGYGHVGSTALLLKPDSDSGAPQRTQAVDLGSLSLSGPYLRISGALSF